VAGGGRGAGAADSAIRVSRGLPQISQLSQRGHGPQPRQGNRQVAKSAETAKNKQLQDTQRERRREFARCEKKLRVSSADLSDSGGRRAAGGSGRTRTGARVAELLCSKTSCGLGTRFHCAHGFGAGGTWGSSSATNAGRSSWTVCQSTS
jgi:hypothetical protein